jgi:hypothetical protein
LRTSPSWKRVCNVSLPACQRTLIEWDAHNYAGASLCRNREKLRLRLLLKDVVHDLDGIDLSSAHQIDECILVLLGRAYTNGKNLAFALEPRQELKCGGIAVPRPSPGVQLDEIDALAIQVAEAPFQPFTQVPFGIALFDAVIRAWGPHAGQRWNLGCNADARRAVPLPKRPCNHALAVAVAVVLRSVYKVTAEFEGAVQCGD